METPISSSDAPPPLTPPPPVITPPPKPRRSAGWMIFAIILLILLCFSLFGNFAQFAHRMMNFGAGFDGFRNGSITRTTIPKLDEFTLEDNDSHNKIAVVTVDGIITSRSDQSGNSLVDLVKAELDRAKDDSRVKAVILKVDSPGGEVMASDQINKLISKFENGGDGKPVICSMGSLAASGGYYISAPCRWIVANDLTLTGSIGVIMESINFRGLMDKIGVRPVVYKSGKFKDMLSGMRETNEIPPGEHAMVQNLIDQTYQKFKNVVAAGRAQAHKKNGDEGR
ncbi:MAG: signal peptide peptidase SppA, partial [Limisphaerales bacterium]